MTRRQRRGAVLCLAAALGAGGCGKRGAPLPPLRPVPARIADVTAERDGARVTLRFTIPKENDDRTTPPVVDRVDVFALTVAAGTPPPAPPQIAIDGNRVGSIEVRPGPRPGDAAGPPTPPADEPAAQDPRPAAGESARVVDAIGAAGDPKQVRYYAAIPFAGRRPGPMSVPIAVPLGPAAPIPGGVSAAFGETEIVLAWSGAEGSFVVTETDERGERAADAAREIATAHEWRTPVEFGRRRCFTVRSVAVAGPVSVLGLASAPICVTPIDTFPPARPAGLLAVPTDEGIELTWSAVPSSDLAGYLILRAEGASGTLQPLTPSAIDETAYRDRDVRSGATYAYVVMAIDRAGNQSTPSDRQVATARSPEIH